MRRLCRCLGGRVKRLVRTPAQTAQAFCADAGGTAAGCAPASARVQGVVGAAKSA